MHAIDLLPANTHELVPPGDDASPGRSAITQAIAEWRDRLGDAHVITDPTSLAAVATTTFAVTRNVPAILRPGDTDDVCAIVHVARRHRVPLHPVSGGRNWGFGSRIPASDGCVLLDLARMDRIVDFSEALSYVTVEPGVTFAQLHAFLRTRGSALCVSATGGSPDGSLVGNALERGDGDGPYGDRGTHVAGLEVVLGTGEVLHTGFARFPGARSAPLHTHGVGPGLEQLFVQSNLGFVTRMSIPLARRPAHTRLWRCHVAARDAVGPVINALRDLVQRGVMRPNAFTLWNGWKLLARERTQAEAAADRATGQAWFFSGRLEGDDPAVIDAGASAITRALAPWSRDLAFGPGDAIAAGVPAQDNLATMYWGKPQGAPRTLDPDRDRCGLSWLCPAIPFDGAAIVEALAIVDAVAGTHGCAPHVGLSALSARQSIGYVALVWDRDTPGADAAMQACHDALLARLTTAGYPPYRLGVQSMRAMPVATGAYDRALDAIRQALDPDGVLAPGRYAA